MKPQNYAAWNLDPAAFDALPPDQRLGFLVGFAVLAPSSHNSQPWRFGIEADAITVAPEPARFLPISDASHRQLYISLGCAIEHIVLAADYYGYRAEVSRMEDEGRAAWRIHIIGNAIPAGTRRKDHLALAVPHRRTSRGAYDDRLPETQFLEWIRMLSGQDLQTRLILDAPGRIRVANLVSKALVEAMDDNAFRFELSHYIHPNVTRAKVGMPMDGFGMPTLLSFIAPFLVRKVNVNRASRKRDEELLSKHTPAFGVLATAADDPDVWMLAGRTYGRIALEAERRGICVAPMAAAIEIGEHYRSLQEQLGTSLRPQVFFRMGYASSKPKHSPRLTAAEVIRMTTV
jgi:hypothetical protein